MSKSFVNKVAGLRLVTFLKSDTGTGVFCEFCKISKDTLPYRTPPVAAFANVMSYMTTVLGFVIY